jgi:hypothetical protein
MLDSDINLEECAEEFISIGASRLVIADETYTVGITERGLMCENVRIIGTPSNIFTIFATS